MNTVEIVLLAIGLGLDTTAISFAAASSGYTEVSIWYPSALIGIVTVVLSLVAIKLGHRLGAVFGQRMEIFGGAILIFIGFRILYSHLLG